MTKKNLLAISFFLCLTACRKNAVINQNLTPPVASFSVSGYTSNNVITIGTYDQYQLTNNSINTVTYFWNLGNDSTSKLKNPVLWYPKSGTYTLTLTAQNENGQKTSVSKTVKVLNRVIKQVVIRGLLNFNGSINPTLNKPNVWAVIKLGANNSNYPFPVGANSSFNAPVVFQSQVIPNLDSANIPYTINVPNKIVLDFPALATSTEQNLGYKGVGYGLELYAQNANGTYLLSSSYQPFYRAQSGTISWPEADIQKNIFIARYGNIDLICDYE